MAASFILELVRQVLRWFTLYLVGIGLPENIAGVFGDPNFVNAVAASITLALADGGWLIVKWKQFRAWLALRSWPGGF